MKKYIILVVTIIALGIFSFWQIKFLDKAQNHINDILNSINVALQIEDYKAANTMYKKLEDKWDDLHDGIDAFSDHMDVETFEKAMVSLGVYIAEKEKADALEQCSILVQVIEHIVESEKISVGSVF